jgi:uncharacterized iron-regulated membrane protein
MNRLIRKLHRWGALITVAPMLLVIVTGLLLQTKKQFAWVQPPTQRGSTDSPSISWAAVLKISVGIEEAQVNNWNDIARLDVQPQKGLIKIQCQNHWEIQIDAGSGEVLQSSYRRSDLIESLHDGSFFTEAAKLWIFLPNGLVLLGLWISGVYLWWLPIGAKRKKLRKLGR